ncbi:MAG: hypothetical protein WD712_01015 [Candidatus Spechtbacterales bacterium]
MLKFGEIAGRLRTPGIVLLLMVLTFSLTLGAVGALGGFNQYEPPNAEARHRDLVNLLSDGEFDSNFLQAELAGTDVLSTSEYVRLVSLTAVRYYTEEEVLAILGVETIEEVPDNIRALFNSDGLLPQTIAQTALSSVLVNDFTIVPISLVSLNVPAEAASRVQLEIVLLPDQRVEDQWKQETLFKGTVEEFVAADGIYPDPEYGLLFLKRPVDRVIAEPNGYPYTQASLDDVRPLNAAIFPRTIGGVVVLGNASVQGVIADRGLVLLSGNFLAQDLGAPVFVLRDGKPQWAGILVSSGSGMGVVVSTQTIKNRVASVLGS